MTDALLTLVMADEVALPVKDVLLSRPDLVRGFIASQAEGYGSVIPLIEAHELVAGHSPRVLIRMLGDEDTLRSVLALIKNQLPRARVFYWLVPTVELGHL